VRKLSRAMRPVWNDERCGVSVCFSTSLSPFLIHSRAFISLDTSRLITRSKIGHRVQRYNVLSTLTSPHDELCTCLARIYQFLSQTFAEMSEMTARLNTPAQAMPPRFWSGYIKPHHPASAVNRFIRNLRCLFALLHAVRRHE